MPPPLEFPPIKESHPLLSQPLKYVEGKDPHDEPTTTPYVDCRVLHSCALQGVAGGVLADEEEEVPPPEPFSDVPPLDPFSDVPPLDPFSDVPPLEPFSDVPPLEPFSDELLLFGDVVFVLVTTSLHFEFVHGVKYDGGSVPHETPGCTLYCCWSVKHWEAVKICGGVVVVTPPDPLRDVPPPDPLRDVPPPEPFREVPPPDPLRVVTPP